MNLGTLSPGAENTSTNRLLNNDCLLQEAVAGNYLRCQKCFQFLLQEQQRCLWVPQTVKGRGEVLKDGLINCYIYYSDYYNIGLFIGFVKNARLKTYASQWLMPFGTKKCVP